MTAKPRLRMNVDLQAWELKPTQRAHLHYEFGTFRSSKPWQGWSFGPYVIPLDCKYTNSTYPAF